MRRRCSAGRRSRSSVASSSRRRHERQPPTDLKAFQAKGTHASSRSAGIDAGALDLVVHVETANLNLEPGDTEVWLAGRTYDREPISGYDTVRIVPDKFRMR